MPREAPPEAVPMTGAQRGDLYRLSNGHLFEVRSLTDIVDFNQERQAAVWGMEHVPEGGDTPGAIGRHGPGAHQRTLTLEDGCYRSFGNVMFYNTGKVGRVRKRKKL